MKEELTLCIALCKYKQLDCDSAKRLILHWLDICIGVREWVRERVREWVRERVYESGVECLRVRVWVYSI